LFPIDFFRWEEFESALDCEFREDPCIQRYKFFDRKYSDEEIVIGLWRYIDSLEILRISMPTINPYFNINGLDLKTYTIVV